MHLKNHLTKNFMKAAARATLMAMLTVGAVAPGISMANPPLPQEPASAVTLVAASQEAKTDTVQFNRVTDYKQLAEKYPFLSGLEQQVKEYDEWQGGTNPALVNVGIYAANGKEMVFVHIDTPVMCSYEGCPLSVYMKNGKDFTLVSQVNSNIPVQVVAKGDQVSLVFPGAYGVNPSVEYRYDAGKKEFQIKEEPQQETPAPVQNNTPNPSR